MGARRLLTELLLQMTQLADALGVYVFAATNRIQVRHLLGARLGRGRACSTEHAR